MHFCTTWAVGAAVLMPIINRVCECLEQVPALFPDGGQQRIVQPIQHAQCGGAADRISSEGGAVVSILKYVLCFFSEERRSQGQTAGQPLGGGNDVRIQAVLHVGIQTARPAVSRLYLVDDQKDVFRAADYITVHVPENDATFSFSALT